MPSSSEPGRSNASRLFAVLDAFEKERGTMNLSAVARSTGLPMATTHRVVKELLDWGALERNSDGSLQIGLKLWKVGSLAPRQRDLRRVARPIMESLYEATQATVQLAVLERNQVVVLEKIISFTYRDVSRPSVDFGLISQR